MSLFRRGPDTRLRKNRTGASPALVGIVVLVIIGAGTYLGFSKHIPFTHGYRLQAVFTSANSIRKNSPVRIAGVDVGKVKAIKGDPGTNSSVITMEIDKKGLPIHKDATAKIRPRIFLEGNFYVDIEPGTPSAPTLSSGDTLPVTQTAVPVQLDQVLSSLQSDTRTALQDLVQGYGDTLTRQPTATEDKAQDPAVKGDTAAQALNAATKTAPSAFKNTAIVNDAFLGTEPHDLSGLVQGLGRTVAALDVNEGELQSLVTNFDRTMAVFAGQATNLRTTISLLPGTLRTAKSALASLNSAFPATRAFAREILPGVRETPSTIDASFPWIAQTRKLLGQDELKGLVEDLAPTTKNLAAVTDAAVQLLPQADLVAQCATNVILPTGDIKISDGSLSTNKENYKEFWYTMVGLAGESQNFDGNGSYVRFQPGGGDQTFSTGIGSAGDRLYGNAAAKPLGTRPKFTDKRPPYEPTAPCKDQKLPDLNGAATGPADGTGNPVPASPAQTAVQGAVAGVTGTVTNAVTGALGALPTKAAKPAATPAPATGIVGSLLAKLAPLLKGATTKAAGR